MKIYLLRHGIAEERRMGLTDGDRRLTAEGIEKMKAEARRFPGLGIKPDIIITSPLPRASETADIAAAALNMAGRVQVDERLACGFSLGEMQAILAEAGTVSEILLVGHEPDLSMIASYLVGGAHIDLKKGGLIRIDTDRPEPGRGLLKWLIAPAVLVGAEE